MSLSIQMYVLQLHRDSRLLNELQIFAWLIDAVGKTASIEEKVQALEGDALLAIIAGRYVSTTEALACQSLAQSPYISRSLTQN